MSLALLAACAEAQSPGKLEMSTPEIDFGAVEMAAVGSARAVALSNSGTLPISLDGFTFASSSGELVFDPPPTRTIEGGATITLRFRYTPTVPDAVTATLTIGAPGAPTVRLRGWGATMGYRIDRPAEACADAPGSIALGTSDGFVPARKTLRITSTGTGPIRVGAYIEAPRPGLRLEPATLDLSLAPGASTELTVVYDPAEPGSAESTLRLTTSAFLARGERVALCAEASFPALCTRPARLDLGMVPAGTTAQARMDVANCGTEPLVVSSVALASGQTSPGFAVTSSAPLTLPPGVATPVFVALASSGPDPQSAVVRVATNAPRDGEALVPVSANQTRSCELVVTPNPIALRAAVDTEQEVRAENVGGQDCVLEALELSPARAPFSIARTPALPTTLPAGAAVAFGVRYAGSTSLARATLTPRVRSGVAADVAVTGDPAAPPGCFLALRSPVLDFGLQLGGMQALSRVEVVNHGQRACRLLRGALTPSSDPRFTLDVGSFPITVRAGSSSLLRVLFTASGDTVGEGRLELTTDDPDHPVLNVRLVAGRQLCTDDCTCEEGETLTLWRYDEAGGPATIRLGNVTEAFERSCDAERCPPGQVAVELARRVFACVPPPPVCTEGEGLDFDPDALPALTCRPCELVIHSGFLFDNVRSCAGQPPRSCTSGRVPTFDDGDRDWSCAPACDSGAYDIIQWDEQLVCIPC